MKKIFTALLIAALAAATFAGCSNNNTSSTSSDGSTSTTSQASSDNSTAGDVSEETEKITGTVNLISREEGSGTRDAFVELTGILVKGDDGTKTDNTSKSATILSNTQTVMSNIAGDQKAIGYISLGSVNDSVKAVKIDGVEASTETVKDGSYKLQRPFNIVTKEDLDNEVANDFIAFILSSDGQKVVEDNGCVAVSEAEAYSGSKPSGEITVAGSSSVSHVMEKLKEAYEAVNPNATVKIQTTDSSTGIQGAINGTCEIGMASRELKDTETGVKAQEIALDGIAVIVNNENPTDDLTLEQIKNIFTGEVTEWENI